MICDGCGRTIGSLINYGGLDVRIVRHDLYSDHLGTRAATWGQTCSWYRTSARSGYAEMVEDVLTAELR